MSEVASRIAPIRVLANEYGQIVDLDDLVKSETAARDLRTSSGVFPTIGCEVEVNASSLFPEIMNDFFGEPDSYGFYSLGMNDLGKDRQAELNVQWGKIDETLKPKYEKTLLAGIPADNDAYWEFAHSPAYSAKTLSTEVDMLINEGLIPKGFEHSLHITLGDIATRGGGPALVLTGLELMHASPNRIRAATKGSRYGTSVLWARRGNDGVRHRHINQLALGSESATEFRTLSVIDEVEIDEVLSSAQILGSILLAFRKRKETSDETVQELALLWRECHGLAGNAIISAGLPLKSWGYPHRNPDKWLRWADFISTRKDKGSIPAAIIEDFKDVESKAKEIIGLS